MPTATRARGAGVVRKAVGTEERGGGPALLLAVRLGVPVHGGGRPGRVAGAGALDAEPGDAVVAARGDDPAAPVDVRAEVGLVADDDAAGKRQVPVIQKDAAAPALPGARRGVLEGEGAVSDGEGPVQEQGPAEALRVSLRAVSGKGAVADVGELRRRDADGAALGLVRALAQVPRKGGAPDLRLLQLQEERAA